MTFTLPALPYARDALAPYISEETLDYHYGKHHQAYVDKLNSLIPGTAFESLSLEEILLKSTGAIFNNAAQVWNHTFYWHSLSPNGGGEPTDELRSALERHFGSVTTFKEQFAAAAVAQFGSGWAWLVKNAHGQLEIVTTSNAGNPLTESKKPLFTCDVWEHAYYIDTRNSRPQYLENFWHLIDWGFVSTHLHN